MRSLGVLAILALSLACGPSPERVAPHDGPINIVHVLVDTLRKDHLRLYGYERRTSDRLDELAARGLTFDNHVSTASQTVPSTLSMLLARYPVEHGFQHESRGHYGRHKPHYPDELLFLAEVLQEEGYATAGFVGNQFLREDTGFNQGYDAFKFTRRPANELTDPAIAWLEERSQWDVPFYLYMHYFDVHWPYKPPQEFLERFPAPADGEVIYRSRKRKPASQIDLEATVAAYDAGVAWVDSEIGRLIDAIDRLGLTGTTLIVVTSDHGDEFLEHGGMGHGSTVFGELVRVPLVLVLPGQLEPGKRIEHLTSHVSLAPTVLELAGIPRPPQFDRPGVLEPTDRVFAENGTWRSVYRGDRKLVLNEPEGYAALFGLADELDQQPLPDEAATAALARDLSWYSKLEALVEGDIERKDTEGWSQEEQDDLRALGYLQ